MTNRQENRADELTVWPTTSWWVALRGEPTYSIVARSSAGFTSRA